MNAHPLTSAAICFIGTKKYRDLFPVFHESCKQHLLVDCNKTFLVFTDKPDAFSPQRDCFFIPAKHHPWPYVTLLRFETILKAKSAILEHEWMLYLDADMKPNQDTFSSEMFDRHCDYIGVQHPAFVHDPNAPFEENPASTAFVPAHFDRSNYWQGCLWGGKSERVIELMETLAAQTRQDIDNGIMARWHDESHLNSFYVKHKSRVHTLSPSYAYPEVYAPLEFEKKIIHVHKNDLEYGNTGAGRKIAWSSRVIQKLKGLAAKLSHG